MDYLSEDEWVSPALGCSPFLWCSGERETSHYYQIWCRRLFLHPPRQHEQGERDSRVSFRPLRRKSSSSLINFACLMMCEEKKEGRGEENQRKFTDVAKHASLSPKFSYIITIIHDESLFFGGKTPPPRSNRDRISDGDVSSHRSSVLGCPPNFLWKRGQCRL